MHDVDAVLNSFSDLFLVSQVLSPIDLFRLSLHIRSQNKGNEGRRMESLGELVTTIAATHNIIMAKGEEVIPTYSSAN
jgi:hypothetical protein